MQTEVLKNDLKLICYPSKHLHSIFVGLYIKMGPVFENKSNNGITHLLEHMHFRQLGDMSQDQLYRKMESIGSPLRGSTYNDLLAFKMQTRPAYLKECIDIFKHIIAAEEWGRKEFDLEKKVVLAELQEQLAYSTIDPYANESIWGNGPLATGILGTRKSIEKLMPEDLSAYKAKYFYGANMALVLTGNVSQEELTFVRDEMEALPIKSTKRVPMRMKAHRSSHQFKRDPDVELVDDGSELLAVRIAFDVDPSHATEDELLFLNSIIGGGHGSILSKSIREKFGFTYAVSAESVVVGDKATSEIDFMVDENDFYPCFKEVLVLLGRLKKNVPQVQIEVNRIFFTDNYWFWLDEPDTLNFQVGAQALGSKTPLTIEEKIRENEKITRLRMRELANEIFVSSNATVIVLGNLEKIDEDKVRDLVTSHL